MRSRSLRSASLVLASAFAAGAQDTPSKNPFVFHQTGVEGLVSPGIRYVLDKPGKKDVGTLWHAHAWKGGGFSGDTYAFLDVDNKGGWYGEVSPNLTLWANNNGGIVKAVQASANFEFVQGLKDRDLFGVGVQWKPPPGFAFLNTYLYHRNDRGERGSTGQATAVWQTKNFGHKNHPCHAEGFIDYAGSEGNSAANIVSQPQFWCNITPRLSGGFEALIWHRKYGVKGIPNVVKTNTIVPQFALRYTFP